MARRTQSDVDASRAETLAVAVQLASVIGLEGLTIGRLARELEMSKSGLIGRFGGKTELQLATLERAGEMFTAAVYAPAADAPSGLARLEAICASWLAYLGDPPFAGGCFLTTASVEFDRREGPVHDAVRRTARRWRAVLERESATAVAAGELAAGTDPAGLAFAINAIAVGTNCEFQLHRDLRAIDQARAALATILTAASAG